MPMAFRVRTSKFRHVYGNASRKEHCYECVRITRNAHDSNFCAVNPKFLAVVVESAGGGSFLLLPLERTGRVDINSPRVCGHAGTVLDIKWNPFNDHIIASSADDNTVKVWQIPEEGLRTNLTEWQVDMHGHQRRVGYIEWHPTAENILLSAGMDFKCMLWNVEQAEPVNVIECHEDTIFSISWNREGSLFATTSKDRKIRVIDPRTATCIAEADGHVGNKASKAVFLGDTGRVFTTGFSRSSERQYAVWDIKNMSKPMKLDNIDCSSGVLLPYYDHDTRVMYLAGKGDGNIRYYELVNDAPFCHYLNYYQSSSPQRGLAMMPKRGCDSSKCEIMRFYKLHAARNFVEPISMIVPRKSDYFQDDLYPPTASMIPSLSTDEWISGQNREPILVSLQDGKVTNTPQITASKAVQKQDGALTQAPTITTYKAVKRTIPEERKPRRANTIATSTVPENLSQEEKKPASIRNIQCLSTNDEYVTISDNMRVNDKIAAFENRQGSPVNNVTPERKTVEKKVWSPTSPTVDMNGFSGSDNDCEKPSLSPKSPKMPLSPSYLPNLNIQIIERSPTPTKTSNDIKRHSPSQPVQSPMAKLLLGKSPSIPADRDTKVHVKKVWSPRQPMPPPMPQWQNGSEPQTDPELRKAYFHQVEEIKSLHEQISLKDKRIRQLEQEISLLRTDSHELGETDC